MATETQASSDPSDTGPQQAEVDGKPNVRHWMSQLTAAKRAARKQLQAAKESYGEYVASFTESPTLKGVTKQAEVRYPVWWSSCKTVEPAIYSRTPSIVANKTFDDLEDNSARLSCLGLGRLGKYLIRTNPFDRVQYATRNDYIHAGKCTERVCFESEIGERVEKCYYTQIQVPDEYGVVVEQWINARGETLADSSTLKQDENGGWYVEEDEESLESVEVCLIPVSYDRLLHTPNARHWEEIDWIAFETLFTKEDVADRFPGFEDKLTYSNFVQGDDKEEKEVLPVRYARIWEVWNKKKGEVYWVGDNYYKDFLDIQSDPYELEGFFPCAPFMLGTVTVEHMYPVPDYIQLRPFIFQLHGMADRLKKLVRAARISGVYDKSIPELNSLATDTIDAEFVGIAAYEDQIVAKGGLEKVIQFFPSERITQAVQQMTAVMDIYEQKFNELYGIPDIMRGASDPNETAAAQQLKGKYNSLRFSSIQREFQRLIRDSIELMCDLALKKFPEDKLQEIMGFKFWKPEDQAIWPQVLLLLRDDEERKVRIDIETDSTISMNQDAEIEQRNYLTKTIFDSLWTVVQIAQGNSELLPVAAESLLYAVRGLRDGKELEATLQSAVQKLLAPQPPQPPPPQPPDYQMLEIQAQQQQIQNDFQIKQAQVQVDAQKIQSDMMIRAREVQVEAEKLAMEAQDKASKREIELRAQQFEEQVTALEMKLGQYKTMLDEREKYMTEARLQQESIQEQIRAHREHLIDAQRVVNEMTAQAQAARPQAPARRIARVQRDAEGNLMGVEITEDPNGFHSGHSQMPGIFNIDPTEMRAHERIAHVTGHAFGGGVSPNIEGLPPTIGEPTPGGEVP